MAPRLPRLYWGEIIYATPGSGKTYVASKYDDVIDGDDLIVEAIEEVNPNFRIIDGDPRYTIAAYFRYINFSHRYMWRVYNIALEKMRGHCNRDDVVLIGTVLLMDQADRVFIQNDEQIVRSGFRSYKEQQELQSISKPQEVHYIDEYLDNCLHKVVQGKI